METTTRNGKAAYRIVNNNAFDVFKFDIQTGCAEAAGGVVCDRVGPVANFVMGAGDDVISAQSGPAGTYGVNLGSGNDDYTGQPGADNADGLGGDDRLQGRDGNDDLDGGTGKDRITGGAGNDDLSGDSNDDRIGGESGNDEIEGGTGADFLVGDSGSDEVSGGDGNDSLFIKEPDGTRAVTDFARCGLGIDSAEGDLADSIAIIGDSRCETQDVSPVGETPHVRIGSGALRVRSGDGRARVRLRCPRGTGGLGCKGRLSLRLDLRGAGRARKAYRIRAGRGKTVTVRLSPRSVRTLRGRQRRGRRTRAVLASVEQGRKGRKTTVRNPLLRLR